MSSVNLFAPNVQDTATFPCGVGTRPLAHFKSQSAGRIKIVLNPGEAGVTPKTCADICTSGVEHQPWLKSPLVQPSRKDCVFGIICQRRSCDVPYRSNSPAWSIAAKTQCMNQGCVFSGFSASTFSTIAACCAFGARSYSTASKLTCGLKVSMSLSAGSHLPGFTEVWNGLPSR